MQPGIARNWGATTAECARTFACDACLPGATEEALYRAVSVDAPAATVFRWLCQMRVAPYSYDWIDNLGRRSPRALTPGIDRLEVGQTFMTIFRLAAFEGGAHVTLVMHHPAAVRIFGELAVTYAIVPTGAATSRIVVKAIGRWRPGLTHAFMRRFLPWGDLVMMRKQLLTFKRLAENAA